MLTFIFVGSVLLIFWAYFGYPLSLVLLSFFRTQNVARSQILPSMTLIITVHNEQKRIRDKLENTLEIDYPRESLQILIASDGSTDATNEIVLKYADRGVELFEVENRGGKENAQKEAVAVARGEIIAFSDASTSIAVEGLKAMAANFDKQDPKFTTLKEELERLFKKKKLSEVSQDQMNANIGSLNEILAKVRELNRQNNLLRDKYQNDPKYARIHKRLLERKDITDLESSIIAALQAVKQGADDQVLHNSEILNNESYFDQVIMPLVIHHFKNEQKILLNVETSKYINGLVVTEYMNEFNGANA